MKKLNFLLIFLTGTVYAAGPEAFDYMGIYKDGTATLHGPAKEIVLSLERPVPDTYAIHNYDVEKRLVKTTYYKEAKYDGHVEYVYDKKGLLREITFNALGKPIDTIIYTRDSAGKVLSYISISNTNEKIIWKYQYVSGKLTAGKRFVNRELTESFTIQNGKQIIKNSQGEKIGETITQMNNGKISARMRLSLAGTKKIEYLYNPDGRLSQMIFYETQKGELIKTKIHKFEYLSLNSLR